MSPPLRGLLVVDLSRVLAGPLAAMMLGDLGARVIKVERPGGGDDTRHFGPPFVGSDDARTSTYFLSVNRNKESIALDLRDPDDLDVLRDLVRRADILIENFRPGVMDRLGLGVDALRALNRGIVVLSITGFGHDGPTSGRVGYDQIVQGESGLMSMTGPDPDHPSRNGAPISDILAGAFGASGALAALHRRNLTGEGEVVRTSLLAASVAAHTFQGTRWLMAGEVPAAIGNRHPTLTPYEMFRCADGFVQIAIGNDEMWRRCAPLVGLDPADPRYRTNADRSAARDTLARHIGEILLRSPVAHWLELFEGHGVPAGEVKSLDQVYTDPQALSQGAVVTTPHPVLGEVRTPGSPLRLDSDPGAEHRPPPLLDEHGAGIRKWLQEADGGSS